MAVYIKVPPIHKKLKQAEEENRVLFISAPSGFGKSAAIHYYYRRKPYLLIGGWTGELEEMPPIASIRQSVVIFEGVCFISDRASQEYIIDIIYHGQKTVILTGRGSLPVWLIKADVELDFVRANRYDLAFTAKETYEYLQKNNFSTTMDVAKLIAERTNGFPLLLNFYVKNMETQVEYRDDILERAHRELYHYLDQSLWALISDDFAKLLLVCCEFETFTIEMMEEITGIQKIPDLIEYAYSVGNLVIYLDDHLFKIDDMICGYIRWKRAFVYSKEDYIDLYKKAAGYYESVKEIESALKYYDKVEMQDKISDLLIQNIDFGPSRMQIYNNRKYLLALPEETIKRSPELMASVSLVYSIMMRQEKSEEWYRILKEYESAPERTEEEKRTARIRRIYLDIYLMHRDTEERIKGLQVAANLRMEEHVDFPELAFTGNTPSLLNGAMDISWWLKKNEVNLSDLIKPLRDIYGEFGNALLTIGIAEEMFEQNVSDSYDLMMRLNKGYALADAAGDIEVCFVAMVLMARQRLTRGRIEAAVELSNSFCGKVKKAGTKFLLPNLNAFMAWISLLQGDVSYAEEWLKQAPDENYEFSALERYQYIHKIRVCIVLGKMEHACSLIQRLNVYLTNYHRDYYWIQNQILFAVALYRSDDVRWKQYLLAALEKAEEYHYVRVIADEGAAVQPMLKILKKTLPHSAFYKEVMDEVDKMAKFYPDYLSVLNKLEEPLTKKEKEILKLLANGKTTEEICDICDISYSGLKFHNRNIYKKLGVNNRQDAERKAVLLRIVD